MSVNVGQTESFKIKTEASAYHIDILRLGYYGGDGARLVAENVQPTAQLPQTQPECLHESTTGLIDCGNWGVSAQWSVPSNAVSGVYIALLTRNDTGGQSQIIFVVRNDASHSKVLLQTSDASWEAYNDYGGNSLYNCTVACPTGNPKAYKAAYSVSYNRPFDGALSTDNGASYLWYAEYQMMRFLEKNGIDVSYTADGEVDHNGALLKNHKVFMSSGHDEYWSGAQRANVEAAREAGVSLAFFSANEVFWKTRWGASIDGSETPYRTLTTYKETHFEGPVDPKDPATWTGAWRDPRGGPQADGGKPENALSGQQFEVNSGTSEITVPAQYSKLRVWRNTAVSGLLPGQTLTLAPNANTLGYEWDEDVDNGFRPAGEFDLSSTTVSGLQSFADYGTTLTNNSTATHHLTLYRASSGALVFGAGTVQWAWGLDNTNAWNEGATDPEHPPVDPNMQQFTVNLLAEMGAPADSLASGLTAPTPSSDTTAPTSTITAPTSGETLQDGSKITISGTASDAGGGVVAGVEVSTDNGTTWHPATLTTPAEQSVNWTYTWAAHGNPATTLKSRAVDDSANLETPAAGAQLKIACPCSIWGNAITPPVPDSGDAHSVEFGVKFTTETFGVVTGVRFYKSAANTGTHVGSLWSASGVRFGESELHQRNGIRLAAGQLLSTRRRLSRHHLRRLVLRALRPLRQLRLLPLHAVGHRRQHPQQPAAARRARERAARERRVRIRQRRVLIRPVEHVPDEQLPGNQLLGRPRVRTRQRSRAGHERDRHRGQRLGHSELESAIECRTRHDVHDHPLHRQRSADADDDQRHPPGDERHRHRADRRDELHVHRAGLQP